MGKINFGDALAGAGTGAAAGSVIPGFGTIAGAAVGGISSLLSDLFSEDEEEEEYRSPMEGLIASEIARLRSDEPSAQFQLDRADATRALDRQEEAIQNSGAGANAAVAERLRESAGSVFGQNLQRIQSAENQKQDQNHRIAAQLAAQQQASDVQKNQFDRQMRAQQGGGLLDTLVNTALPTAFGSFLAKELNPEKKDG